MQERTFSLAEAWLDLIQLARFEARPATILTPNGRQVVIKQGEIHASLRWLSERWGWGRNLERTRKFLDRCIAGNKIEKRSENGETILKLVNYQKYNYLDEGYNGGYTESDSEDVNFESITDIDVTPTVTPTVTNNNKENKEKKEKKEKNISPGGDVSGDARPLPPSNDFLNYISLFNEVRGARFQAIQKVRVQFNARLKEGFTPAQMIEALKNAMKEKNHIESGYRYLTPEFFTRSDKLDRFLNVPASGRANSVDDFEANMMKRLNEKTE
jgi:hypothetical protein